MRKKLTLLALTLVLAFSMTACKSRPYSQYDLSEYIKLAEYKGLEVDANEVKITDKEVEERIKTLQEESATTESITEGKVEDGDTVIINYKGTMDGEAFEGGSAQNYSLTIGSNAFIPGFESGLVGAEIGGDPIKLDLQFPDPYPNNEELSGKAVTFEVTILSKEVSTLPELDADFFKSQGSSAKDLESYKKELKEQMEEDAKAQGEDAQKQALWEQVVSKSEVLKDEDGNEKYPEEEVKKAKDQVLSQYKDYAESYGMSYEDLIKNETDQTVEEFEAEVEEYAKTEVVKENLVLYAIAEKEGISVTHLEYTDYIDEFLKNMGFESEKSFESASGQTVEDYFGGKEAIQREIIKEKVLDLILDNAKVKGEEDKKDTKKDEAKDESKDSEKSDEAKDDAEEDGNAE